MATTVEVPQLGDTVEECLITRWVKRKGDSVAAGDVVAEIETDKTTFEVTAPVSGTVLETFFEEGALVPVFTRLLVIGHEGESVDALPSAVADVARPAVVEEPARRVEQPIATAPGNSGADEAVTLSPRARTFAARHDVDPLPSVGSGPGGRVLEQDVRAVHEARAQAAPPLSSTRQTIARRMRESLASTAQYTLHSTADARGLLTLRAQSKVAHTDVTINDLVVLCTIQALLEAPEVNAELVGGRIVTHSEVHLAFACDTPRGLTAPVVRDAHALSLSALSARMKALSAQAVGGTIATSDLSGATFTVSNLGSLGIESFTPVLNPPQVAILGVGAIQLKAVRTQAGVEFIDVIGLSLTCDHQVVDGAPGARFLQILQRKIAAVESLR